MTLDGPSDPSWEEVPLSDQVVRVGGFRIGLLGVIGLVLLRITVGWHFVTQGMDKFTNPNFSSKGYLSQAKGPFAERFHELIPDYDGRERLSVEKTQERFNRMLDGVKNQYGFNADQAAQAQRQVAEAVADVEDYLEANKQDIGKYFQDLELLTKRRHQPDYQEAPFAQKWVWDKQQELQSTMGPWVAWIDNRARELLGELNKLGDGIEPEHPPYEEPPSQLAQMDKLVMYSNLAIGACLIAGLFTRFASFGGALFMLSLILAQPPWPTLFPAAHPSAGAQWIVNKEVIEMMALFALAFLPTGRWGGLDFFVHHLITRPLFGGKETA